MQPQPFAQSATTTTHRSDDLFAGYGEDVLRVARKIERGEPITEAEATALPGGVDARYGDEITLLFRALASRNLEAIHTLLAAGADPYMIDRPSQGSARSFAYYLTLPGNPAIRDSGLSFINRLIDLYLEHGGDPRYRLGGSDRDPLIARVALSENYEGIMLLLEAGADPWEDNARQGNAMTRLAANGLSHDMLNRLIEQGYFDDVSLPKLREFMSWLSLYTQRGDEISLANQEIGRRVLKRNPGYPADRHTERLFQGPIPWSEIESES